MFDKIRVTIWNEFLHEKKHKDVRRLYPEGIHGAIGGYLDKENGFSVGYATLEEAEHGLSQGVVEATDVLIWWGHVAHERVEDQIVDRVQKSVQEGMGLIVLHSGHYSKIFRRLMGSSCSLRWREAAEKERLWNLAPDHPITEGIGECIELANEEMYGEHFDIPQPDELIFVSWFEGGEVFRSGCCWRRGYGRIFYFQPGHESYPTYHNPQVLRVIGNAARWAACRTRKALTCRETPALERLSAKQGEFGRITGE